MIRGAHEILSTFARGARRLAAPLAALWLASAAGAQAAPAECAIASVRSLCVASCAAACEETAFLQAHAGFCRDNGALSGAGAAKLEDDPVCATLFAEAPAEDAKEETGSPDPAGDASEAPAPETTAAEGDEGATEKDCSAFERPSERIRCETTERPSCSDNVLSLEADARLLATEVEQELGNYGDLLARDLTSVESRDLLCEFSLEELDKNYLRATQDPAALRTIQRRAGGIQQCRGEWEKYLRNSSKTNNQVSDRIFDNVARDVEAQFEPLKGQLQNLSSSITRLEQAAGTIEGLIRIHIDFCDPDGTPIQN